MSVILTVQCRIDGVVRDPGYEYTGTDEVEGDLVYRNMATYVPVSTAMVTSEDTVQWMDTSVRKLRTDTVDDFCAGAAIARGVVWDDLTFAASGINLPGAAADATRDNATGMLKFAGNADNVIAGSAQMRHAWKEQSIVRPHLHLRFPTANAGKNSRWKFEYDLANINGPFTNNYGTYTTLASITVANPDDVKKSVIASFGDLDMTGFGISTCIAWRISRLAATDILDDDTSDIILTDFDIHYQRDANGSVLETAKVAGD
jgi:hypothetical protein